MNMDEHFIGREAELEILQDIYESPKGELAIVYGRRRIGKSALLRHFCDNKNALYYTAKYWPDSMQLIAFSEAVTKHCHDLGSVTFKDWIDAIKALVHFGGEGRKIIVLDEFQYIAQNRPSILSELQAAWDESLGKENLLLILCGSAVSFIAKEVLGEKNPLYGRAGTIMKLAPLPFIDAVEFCPNYSPDDKFRSYAVLGGTPYYWDAFRPEKTLEENIAFSVLRSSAFLHDEPMSVLMQEFRDPLTYNVILTAIANGAVAFNEIAQKALVNGHVLPHYLSVLQNLEFIEKELPVFAGPGERGRASRGLYKISDNYLRFWFRFVAPSPIDAATTRQGVAIWRSIEPDFSEFAAPAFEQICREYLVRQQFAGKLPLSLTHFGRWWFKNVEIDIVGADASRRKCLVGECKYKNEKVGLRILRDLDAKAAQLPIADDAEIHRWLFSKSGFDDKLIARAAADPTIHLVSLEDLVKRDL